MNAAYKIIQYHRNQYQQYYREFYDTFGVPLKHYWDNLSGFDVVKFDDYLQPPEGVSSYDHCAARFGKDSADFILNRLLCMPRVEEIL